MKIKTELPKIVSEIDEKIDALKPGGNVELSKVGDIKVMAERSGDGKKLIFYRETSTGFEVIKRESF